MKTNYEQIVDVAQIGRHGTVNLNEVFRSGRAGAVYGGSQ